MAWESVTNQGDTETFALDLVPGRRYGFLCLLNRANGDLHALLGMNGEFRAPGPIPAQAPETTVTTAKP